VGSIKAKASDIQKIYDLLVGHRHVNFIFTVKKSGKRNIFLGDGPQHIKHSLKLLKNAKKKLKKSSFERIKCKLMLMDFTSL